MSPEGRELVFEEAKVRIGVGRKLAIQVETTKGKCNGIRPNEGSWRRELTRSVSMIVSGPHVFCAANAAVAEQTSMMAVRNWTIL